MNKAIFFLLYSLLPCLLFAQNDLQKCAEEKNKAIIKIVENKNWSDSAATKDLQALNDGWKECVIGKDIPPFEAETIKGDKINNAVLKGKVVVLNFWFTTCPPCVAEIPAFNQLVSEYANKDVVFIGMSFNNKKTLKEFLHKKPFRVRVISNAGAMEELFGVLEHPVTFIIDKEGKIRLALTGGAIGDKAKEEAYARIKPAIDEWISK